MFSWSSLFTLVSFVGSAIAIFEFIRLRQSPGSRPQKLAVICGVVFIALFVGSIIFSPILSSGNERVVNPAPTSSNSAQVPGTTPTAIQATPAQPPTPSPTSAPKPGDVLYQADQSWSGWSGTKEWHIGNGMLINDGHWLPWTTNYSRT